MHDKKLNFHFLEKKIAFIFDDPHFTSSSNGILLPEDAAAEWETPATIRALIHAWQTLGYNVIALPLDSVFFERWQQVFLELHFVHSVVEGWGSVSRESWIPNLCELSGVPHLGSPPDVITLSMNKYLCKNRVGSLGIPVAPGMLVHKDEVMQKKLTDLETHKRYFIKPNSEGSSMGIVKELSLPQNQQELVENAKKMLERFPEGILIENHLNGPEFTVGVWGDGIVLTPAQISVDGDLYGYQQKTKSGRTERVTFLSQQHPLYQTLCSLSQKIYTALGFRDYARFDWKCDEEGEVYFLEANALPGLSPEYSVFPEMLKHDGWSLKNFFAELAKAAEARKDERPYQYGRCLFHNRGFNSTWKQ